MVQIQELQDEVNSLEFFDPETASSSGLSHVPSQLVSMPSPRVLISRDSCLQLATRNSLGATGCVFEDLPAPDGPSSALFGISKNFASASCGSVLVDTGRVAERAGVLEREHQNRATPTPRFARKFSTLNPPLMLRELILKIGWLNHRGVKFQNCISINSWHCGLPVFEDEFQGRSMLLFRKSYSRNVVGQRSACFHIYSSSGVLIRDDPLQRRRNLRIKHLKFWNTYSPIDCARRWHTRFRNKMGPNSISCKWSTQGKSPGEFVHDENT